MQGNTRKESRPIYRKCQTWLCHNTWRAACPHHCQVWQLPVHGLSMGCQRISNQWIDSNWIENQWIDSNWIDSQCMTITWIDSRLGSKRKSSISLSAFTLFVTKFSQLTVPRCKGRALYKVPSCSVFQPEVPPRQLGGWEPSWDTSVPSPSLTNHSNIKRPDTTMHQNTRNTI